MVALFNGDYGDDGEYALGGDLLGHPGELYGLCHRGPACAAGGAGVTGNYFIRVPLHRPAWRGGLPTWAFCQLCNAGHRLQPLEPLDAGGEEGERVRLHIRLDEPPAPESPP
jgi:hypothetical protein